MMPSGECESPKPRDLSPLDSLTHQIGQYKYDLATAGAGLTGGKTDGLIGWMNFVEASPRRLSLMREGMSEREPTWVDDAQCMVTQNTLETLIDLERYAADNIAHLHAIAAVAVHELALKRSTTKGRTEVARKREMLSHYAFMETVMARWLQEAAHQNAASLTGIKKLLIGPIGDHKAASFMGAVPWTICSLFKSRAQGATKPTSKLLNAQKNSGRSELPGIVRAGLRSYAGLFTPHWEAGTPAADGQEMVTLRSVGGTTSDRAPGGVDGGAPPRA